MKTLNIQPILQSISAPGIALVLLATVPAVQAIRLNSNHSVAVLTDAITSGGSIAQPTSFEIVDANTGERDPALSGTYQISASVGDIVEAVTDTEGAVVGVPAEPTKISGFCGALYEIRTLQLNATHSSLAAGNATALKLTAVLHDNSTIEVDPRYAVWHTPGPLDFSMNATTRQMFAIARAVGTESVALVNATFLRSAPATSSLTILSDGTGPVVASATLSGRVGTPFTYTINATNSPTSYSNSTALPAGLLLNTTTGLISGTPTLAGDFTTLVLATNDRGTGNATLTFNIASAPFSPFDNWTGGNVTLNSSILARYAIGAGSYNGTTAFQIPVLSTSGGNLSITALIRTNDTALTVTGETITSLGGNWTTLGNGTTAGVDQTGAPADHQRRRFSTPIGSDSKKFLRLRAVYTPSEN